MSNVFSGSEIVEIAIQIEKNGRDFYREVSKCSSDEKAKKIYNFLMEAETDHIGNFTKLLSSIQRYEPPEAYPGEYFAYMKALADDHVFARPNAGCELGQKVESDVEAINMGIGFEKDTIKFYESMKKAAPEKDQPIIDALIEEEKLHLRELGKLKRMLEGK